MPRGVPKNGFRMTKKHKEKIGAHPANARMLPIETEPVETDAQIDAKLRERFEILELITDTAIAGDLRSMIVSGPAGLGKSFTVEEKLADFDPDKLKHTIVKGYVRTTGLFRTLFDYRHKGNVIVFDDADSIFNDDVALSLLKAVCDTTEDRWVSYLSDYDMGSDEDGNSIPKTFKFNGTIIFITNLDFDDYIRRGSKLAPHMSALISRSHYIDLAMKTERDYFIRIKQVVEKGMLREMGVTDAESRVIMQFIEDNLYDLRELSLRMAIKLSHLIRKPKFEAVARVTCCKNRT